MIVQACCEMRKMPVVRCAAALTDAYLPLLPLACTSQRAARDKEDQERLKELALLRRLSLVENAGSLLGGLFKTLSCRPLSHPPSHLLLLIGITHFLKTSSSGLVALALSIS